MENNKKVENLRNKISSLCDQIEQFQSLVELQEVEIKRRGDIIKTLANTYLEQVADIKIGKVEAGDSNGK